MALRPLGITALTLALGIALVGCAGESAPAEPVASASPTPSATPSVEPEVEAYDVISCQTIVTQPTLDEFEARGFELADDYETTLRNEGSPERYFFEYGGVACVWFLPNSDTFAPFGYSKISAAEAAAVQDELSTSGYARSEVEGNVYYASDPADNALGHFDTFMFDETSWYHAVDENGINEVRNAVSVLNLQD